MSLLNLLYPPQCMHCRQPMKCHRRLCSNCLSHFTLLPKEGHCVKCAASIALLSGICVSCRAQSHKLKRLAACFDAFGPASSLVNRFHKTRHPLLAQEIASFMVVQLNTLDYPSFDCITMVPNALFNPHYAIGRCIAQLLEIPFVPALKRELTSTINFSLKSRCNLLHKRLLLVDVEMNSRLILRKAAEALARGWPETQYGLTFCATC